MTFFEHQNATGFKNEESYLAEFMEKSGGAFFFHRNCLWRCMGLRFYVPTPSCFPISLTTDDLDVIDLSPLDSLHDGLILHGNCFGS